MLACWSVGHFTPVQTEISQQLLDGLSFKSGRDIHGDQIRNSTEFSPILPHLKGKYLEQYDIVFIYLQGQST